MLTLNYAHKHLLQVFSTLAQGRRKERKKVRRSSLPNTFDDDCGLNIFQISRKDRRLQITRKKEQRRLWNRVLN